MARSSDTDARDDLGDWEQYGATIYQWLDYQDLYALAGNGGRRHEQLYFEFDNCCFLGIKGEESREIYERAYGVGTTVTFTVVAGHTSHYAMPVTLLADKMRD